MFRCTQCPYQSERSTDVRRHYRRVHQGLTAATGIRQGETARQIAPEPPRPAQLARRVERVEPEPSRELARYAPSAGLAELSELDRLRVQFHFLSALEIKIASGLASPGEQFQFERGKAEYDWLYDSIAAGREREGLTEENMRLRAELAEAKRQAQPGLLTRLLNPKPNGNGNGHAPAEMPADFEPQAAEECRRELWRQRQEWERERIAIFGR
ncbi:MAG TPA: hypothetical protein VGR81_06350 [Candidatus Acidoferrales bacterium]|nr:hypothetical protein [Candidatus Acidoferrales bacterium]